MSINACHIFALWKLLWSFLYPRPKSFHHLLLRSVLRCGVDAWSREIGTWFSWSQTQLVFFTRVPEWCFGAWNRFAVCRSPTNTIKPVKCGCHASQLNTKQFNWTRTINSDWGLFIIVCYSGCYQGGWMADVWVESTSCGNRKFTWKLPN